MLCCKCGAVTRVTEEACVWAEGATARPCYFSSPRPQVMLAVEDSALMRTALVLSASTSRINLSLSTIIEHSHLEKVCLNRILSLAWCSVKGRSLAKANMQGHNSLGGDPSVAKRLHHKAGRVSTEKNGDHAPLPLYTALSEIKRQRRRYIFVLHALHFPNVPLKYSNVLFGGTNGYVSQGKKKVQMNYTLLAMLCTYL